ncbi:Coiled-coil domain-containing protein [Trichinella nativa]|uniref:Cilia- and flagella-associated protein 36 n=1 Tax=Trichinella nativa TaxID=6335 RepID=A0A0V1LBL7_9BILA|nr:Coiled-coil domain-containing protein [Trichinella sp. T6]KRZ56945.1 Coiled-coil domain-containing protein [Trichinella nativa]
MRNTKRWTQKKQNQQKFADNSMDFYEVLLGAGPSSRLLKTTFNKSATEEETHLQIFEDYKIMVNALIQSFCEEQHIDYSTLGLALQNEQCSEFSIETVSAYEAVLAASDYNLFSRMMVKKNAELQLQALAVIYKHASGNTSPSSRNSSSKFTDHRQRQNAKAQTDKRHSFLDYFRISENECAAEQRKLAEADEELKEAIRLSLIEQERINALEKQEAEIIQKISLLEWENSQKIFKNDKFNDNSSSTVSTDELSFDHLTVPECPSLPYKELLSSLINNRNNSDGQMDEASTSQHQHFPNVEDQNSDDILTKRRQYLTKLRDKLIETRQQQRQLNFSALMEKDSHPEQRPRTSQTALKLMSHHVQIPKETDEMQAKKLMEKLKISVIDKSNFDHLK